MTHIFDGTRFTSYPLPPERAFPLPAYRGGRQLTCDPQGRIWLRNNLTLYVVDTQSSQVVANIDSLLATLQLTPDQVAAWPCPKDTSHWKNMPNVMTVANDAYGGLWIGTKEQGILYQNQARFRQFTTQYSSFPYSKRPNFCSPRASQLAARYAPLATNCTLDDLKGYVYLGTRRGVMIIDSTDRLVATLDHRYGLSTDNVQSIIRDNHGQVWIATANGISRICTVGRDSFDITNYSHPDGICLNGSEFRTCRIHCDSTGVITVGFVGGLIRFHPDSVNVPRHTFHFPSTDSVSGDGDISERVFTSSIAQTLLQSQYSCLQRPVTIHCFG